MFKKKKFVQCDPNPWKNIVEILQKMQNLTQPIPNSRNRAREINRAFFLNLWKFWLSEYSIFWIFAINNAYKKIKISAKKNFKFKFFFFRIKFLTWTYTTKKKILLRYTLLHDSKCPPTL